MNFYKNLFAKNKKLDQSGENQEKQTFEDLIEQYIGLAFEKQMDLEDIIYGKPWQIDMAKQQLVFVSYWEPFRIHPRLGFGLGVMNNHNFRKILSSSLLSLKKLVKRTILNY